MYPNVPPDFTSKHNYNTDIYNYTLLSFYDGIFTNRKKIKE